MYTQDEVKESKKVENLRAKDADPHDIKYAVREWKGGEVRTACGGSDQGRAANSESRPRAGASVRRHRYRPLLCREWIRGACGIACASHVTERFRDRRRLCSPRPRPWCRMRARVWRLQLLICQSSWCDSDAPKRTQGSRLACQERPMAFFCGGCRRGDCIRVLRTGLGHAAPVRDSHRSFPAAFSSLVFFWLVPRRRSSEKAMCLPRSPPSRAKSSSSLARCLCDVKL